MNKVEIINWFDEECLASPVEEINSCTNNHSNNQPEKNGMLPSSGSVCTISILIQHTDVERRADFKFSISIICA